MTDVVPLPPGFRAAGLHCGIKRSGAPDLGLLVADQAAAATAIFTRCPLQGAHVPLSRDSLQRSGGRVRALLVNSGNANCATGESGLDDARRVGTRLAELLDCPPEQVLFWSTGVIGQRLPVDRVLDHLEPLLGDAGTAGLPSFAEAILTTDTHAKVATARGRGKGDAPFRITGVAKGSGMIHPDMATMLAVLTTDARSSMDHHLLLRGVADETFHRVTVDGDTSPNDAVLLWSSEQCAEAAAGEGRHAVLDGLREVCRTLARAIAADGEGASRLLTIRVRGAPSEREAALVGRTIGTSLLTKTAVFGRDPNWGRIACAAARAGVAVRTEALRVAIGGAVVYETGQPRPDGEPAAHRHMESSREVVIDVDLGNGPCEAECWSCDLTPDYVRINADYRT